MRDALAPGASGSVADEKVGGHLHARRLDHIEVDCKYGWSIVHCLPVSMAEQPSAAISGTVIRTETVRALASEAGLTRFEVLPVDGGFFRLYRLRAH